MIARGKGISSDWLLTKRSEKRQFPGLFGVDDGSHSFD